VQGVAELADNASELRVGLAAVIGNRDGQAKRNDVPGCEGVVKESSTGVWFTKAHVGDDDWRAVVLAGHLDSLSWTHVNLG